MPRRSERGHDCWQTCQRGRLFGGVDSVQTAAVGTPQPPPAVTEYDLILIQFSHDRKNWTIKHRSKHCSTSRLFLREASELAVHGSRDRPEQRVHARDHQCDSRRLRGAAGIIRATRSYRIGDASWLGRAVPREAAEIAAAKTSEKSRWSSKSWTTLFLR